MNSAPIARKVWAYAAADGTGSRGRSVALCFLVGALLGLMGCGYAGQPNAGGSHADSNAAGLQATPSLIAFGDVVSGQSYSQTVRLSNSGTSNVTITRITASGSGFSASGLSLPLLLAAGQSASFSAAFMSTINGKSAGGIMVASDATASAMTIGISAVVVPSSTQLTPSTSSVNFGNGTVGVAETQNVTLTNTGNSSLSISAVSTSGAGFSASGGGIVTLMPSQTVNVTVSFDAAGVGPATGNLMVIGNGAAVQIGLAGMGVNAGVQHSVGLRWSPSTSTVAGYYVYRGDGLAGGLSRLIASSISTTSYTDSTVVSGQSYNYAVTSVDSDNVESIFSNQSAVTIPGN